MKRSSSGLLSWSTKRRSSGCTVVVGPVTVLVGLAVATWVAVASGFAVAVDVGLAEASAVGFTATLSWGSRRLSDSR